MAPRRGRPHYPRLTLLSGRRRELTPVAVVIATVVAVKFAALPGYPVCRFEGP